MAWQVALILDSETNLNVAVGRMPIWAQTTEKRVAEAAEFYEQWNAMWHPEPGFTLITTPPVLDLERAAAEFVPVLAEHHPQLYSIHLFGVPPGERLNALMAGAGFYPTHRKPDSGLLFARSLEEAVKELVLDASAWDETSDWRWETSFYDAFFKAVGAPEWHGRNLNVLNDSISTGGINQIEGPYKILIRNVPEQNPLLTGFLNALNGLMAHLRSQGCPVQMQIIPRN